MVGGGGAVGWVGGGVLLVRFRLGAACGGRQTGQYEHARLRAVYRLGSGLSCLQGLWHMRRRWLCRDPRSSVPAAPPTQWCQTRGRAGIKL